MAWKAAFFLFCVFIFVSRLQPGCPIRCVVFLFSSPVSVIHIFACVRMRLRIIIIIVNDAIVVVVVVLITLCWKLLFLLLCVTVLLPVFFFNSSSSLYSSNCVFTYQLQCAYWQQIVSCRTSSHDIFCWSLLPKGKNYTVAAVVVVVVVVVFAIVVVSCFYLVYALGLINFSSDRGLCTVYIALLYHHELKITGARRPNQSAAKRDRMTKKQTRFEFFVTIASKHYNRALHVYTHIVDDNTKFFGHAVI